MRQLVCCCTRGTDRARRCAHVPTAPFFYDVRAIITTGTIITVHGGLRQVLLITEALAT